AGNQHGGGRGPDDGQWSRRGRRPPGGAAGEGFQPGWDDVHGDPHPGGGGAAPCLLPRAGGMPRSVRGARRPPEGGLGGKGRAGAAHRELRGRQGGRGDGCPCVRGPPRSLAQGAAGPILVISRLPGRRESQVKLEVGPPGAEVSALVNPSHKKKHIALSTDSSLNAQASLGSRYSGEESVAA